MHVSNGTFRSKVPEEQFIRASNKVGWPETEDIQDLDSNNGVQRWLRYVSKDGKRQDAARVYLHDKLADEVAYPNLHVLVQSKVVRVLLSDDEEKRAVGVEYVPNPDFTVELATTIPVKKQVKARKLVVVSCGALGTPAVLERSGLGDPKVLERAGVEVKVDLPGVGKDYQDHNLILYPYATNLEAHQTSDEILRAPTKRQEFIDAKDERIGWNSIDIASKLRPSDEDVAKFSPEFKAAWDKDFANQPNRPLMLMAMASW